MTRGTRGYYHRRHWKKKRKQPSQQQHLSSSVVATIENKNKKRKSSSSSSSSLIRLPPYYEAGLPVEIWNQIIGYLLEDREEILSVSSFSVVDRDAVRLVDCTLCSLKQTCTLLKQWVEDRWTQPPLKSLWWNMVACYSERESCRLLQVPEIRKTLATWNDEDKVEENNGGCGGSLFNCTHVSMITYLLSLREPAVKVVNYDLQQVVTNNLCSNLRIMLSCDQVRKLLHKKESTLESLIHTSVHEHSLDCLEPLLLFDWCQMSHSERQYRIHRSMKICINHRSFLAVELLARVDVHEVLVPNKWIKYMNYSISENFEVGFQWFGNQIVERNHVYKPHVNAGHFSDLYWYAASEGRTKYMEWIFRWSEYCFPMDRITYFPFSNSGIVSLHNISGHRKRLFEMLQSGFHCCLDSIMSHQLGDKILLDLVRFCLASNCLGPIRWWKHYAVQKNQFVRYLDCNLYKSVVELLVQHDALHMISWVKQILFDETRTSSIISSMYERYVNNSVISYWKMGDLTHRKMWSRPPTFSKQDIQEELTVIGQEYPVPDLLSQNNGDNDDDDDDNDSDSDSDSD